MSATTKSNAPAKMNRIPTPPASLPSHAAIALCAQGIWEAEGRPEGRALEHWLLAEAQLTEHPPITAGSQRGEQPRRSKQGGPLR